MPISKIISPQSGSAAAQAHRDAEIREQAVQRNRDPAMQKLEDNTRAEFERRASQALKQHWLDIGGPSSPLGLPLQPHFDGKSNGGDFLFQFRGGDLVFGSDGQIRIDNPRAVRLMLAGYVLEQRQEKGDEIYGTITAMGPAADYNKSIPVPLRLMGPEANNRVASLDLEIYSGPPCDLHVLAQFIEHDSGNREDVRNEIRKMAEDVMKAAQEAALIVAAPGASEAADAGLTTESETASQLRGMAADLYTTIIDAVLGAGDDPYNSHSFHITASEMIEFPPALEYRRPQDSRTIQYTHERLEYGVDDGGDQGAIRVLLRLEQIA